MKKMSVSQVRPFIRYAQILKIDENLQFENIVAYDYRLFFVRDGKGEIVVDGRVYPMQKGALIMWRPGVEYSLLHGGRGGMEMIGISFDLCFSNSHRQVPIPPSKASDFRRDEIVEPHDMDVADFLNEAVYCVDCRETEFELLRIYAEYKNKLKFFEQKISGMFLTVLSEILRKTEKSGEAGQNNGGVERILRVIRENYDKPLTNQLIGGKLGYHPNHVSRLMVLYTGMSLHRYVQNYRIEKAMDLLQMTDMSVMQIGEAVGFRDFTHFSKYFKKKTGYTPTAFRIGRR